MDDDERESFLKSIYDTPADDLPRLVFADWLDERGESEWAAMIRIQCHDPEAGRPLGCERGFPIDTVLKIPAELLADAGALRTSALKYHPHWYGATDFKLDGGLIQSGKPIQTLFTSPVTARIIRCDLSGAVSGIGDQLATTEITAIDLLREYEFRPVVTVQAVEALVNAREARRLTHLDLRNNDLDNDAARAIVNSKNLIRLQSLHLFDGNQLRGRTWQQLLERFGNDAVQ